MKSQFLPLVFTLFLSVSFFAQKKNSSKKPTSIYTISSIQNSKNSFSVLNQKLKLNNFNFIYVNQNDLDLNLFSVQFKDIGKNPSAFIHDDYIAYRDEFLLKGFLLKNDPTRWNLQCPSPLSVQPTE
jgi:hypothetical protein